MYQHYCYNYAGIILLHNRHRSILHGKYIYRHGRNRSCYSCLNVRMIDTNNHNHSMNPRIYIDRHGIGHVHCICLVRMLIDGNFHQQTLVYRSTCLHGNNHLHRSDLDTL
jgi:hypothetical protein